jgi:general secretion pathway protein E
MRIDGVLRETLRMPPHVAPVVVSRIKVMARLDIAERRVPQDGRIGLTLGRQTARRPRLDLAEPGGRARRAAHPRQGECRDRLDVLGMTPATAPAARMRSRAQRHHSRHRPDRLGQDDDALCRAQLLNDGSRNILTVEDPVEYAVDGVGQTQVNPKVGLTFAAGLRAILRQDPDVVMVGEIRDRETAEIAVQASLTGHLVLSTVHTNDAVGAITRMRDMKVEPFLLASTLRAVIAQRLVRRCASIAAPGPASRRGCGAAGLEPGTTVYEPGGCERAADPASSGRIGVFEAIRVDETIRRLINEGGDEVAIAATPSPPPNLATAARQLVREGKRRPRKPCAFAPAWPKCR